MAKHLSGLNLAMIARVLGWLLMIESGFMVIPFVTSLIYREESGIRGFCISIAITFICGAAMAFLSRPKQGDMGKRESFLLTTSVWIILSLFGMFPYILTDHPLSISNAFIEAMSGFTTTGLSAVDSGMLTRGQMMWNCVMQWVGGMGIILFTLAVLPMLNHSGGMQMFNAETTGITHDKLRPRVSETAKSLWIIYVILTGLLFCLLWIGPLGIFDSLCITFSTVSTGGGFGPASELLSGSMYLKVVVTVFMFLGGVNFQLMYKVAHGHFAALMDNEVFRDYVKVICFAFLLFVCSIWFHSQLKDLSSITIDPLFQIVSSISSTGFTAPNFKSWGPFAYTIVMILMFVGAGAGSTSGGAKLDRVIYLFKSCYNEIVKTLRPNTILSVRLNNKIVPYELVSKVMVFLAIYVLVMVIGGLALTAFGVDQKGCYIYLVYVCEQLRCRQ